METLMIYEAEACDATDIIEYLNVVSKETNNLTFDECKLNELEEMEIINDYLYTDNSVYYIGVLDDKIVSACSLTGNDKKRTKHSAEFGITVLKEYWRRGIASAMIEETIDYAKKHGIEIISLEVKENNVNAINLYKKFGFEIIGVYKNYFKIDNNYYDAYLMNLIIKI